MSSVMPQKDFEVMGHVVLQRILVGVLGVASSMLLMSCKEPPRRSAAASPSVLPSLTEVPDFSLTNQRGASISRQDLIGAPWIANTFFTTCRTICPSLMNKVAYLHTASDTMSPPVRFISITVDPDNDTPAALARYWSKWGASGRWDMLTGDFDAIRHLVVDGFQTAMGQSTVDETGTRDITHSGKLYLVDAEGVVRGYYASDDLGVKTLLGDLQRIAQ